VYVRERVCCRECLGVPASVYDVLERVFIQCSREGVGCSCGRKCCLIRSVLGCVCVRGCVVESVFEF